MRKTAIVAVGVAVLGAGVAGVAVASTDIPMISTAKTLHLVSPIKDRITTPTTDLTIFQGVVTSRSGGRAGSLQGYCATIDDKTGQGECTTTITLAGGQVTLIGPIHNRSVGRQQRQAVAGGTGIYQNARGQAVVSLTRSQDVHYDISLIP